VKPLVSGFDVASLDQQVAMPDRQSGGGEFRC
jgi:hypothetical protein